MFKPGNCLRWVGGAGYYSRVDGPDVPIHPNTLAWVVQDSRNLTHLRLLDGTEFHHGKLEHYMWRKVDDDV